MLEETNPVKGRAFKAHMKDKQTQEKAKMVQEVTDNKIAKGNRKEQNKIYYKREAVQGEWAKRRQRLEGGGSVHANWTFERKT